MEAEAARNRFKKIRARFAQLPAAGLADLPGTLDVRLNGREIEILANGNSQALVEQLKGLHPEELRCESLSLEEIFIASKTLKKA